MFLLRIYAKWYIAFSGSTKAIVKFQKLRSLLEIDQNFLIVHHFDQLDWGLILMGECLGLNLFRQQWEEYLFFFI